MENLHTALIKAAGSFNESTGGASKLAAAIQSIADALPNVKFDNTIGGINAITGAVEGAISRVGALIGKLGDLGKANGAVAYAEAHPTAPSTDDLNNFFNGNQGKDVAQKNIDAALATRDKITNSDIPQDMKEDAIAAINDQLVDLQKNLVAADQTITDIKATNRPQPPHSLTPKPKEGPTKPTVDITAAKYAPVGGDGTGKGHHKPTRSRLRSTLSRSAPPRPRQRRPRRRS